MSLAVRIPTRFRRGRKHRSPFRLDETKKEWVGMQTTLTAKLKLVTTPEQFRQLRLTQLAYRDALNQASQHAFAHGKTSNSQRLHRDLYDETRARYGLPSQMACSVFRQVGATYKGLWTKWYKNVEARKAGWTRKRFKGLDQPPHYVSPTLTSISVSELNPLKQLASAFRWANLRWLLLAWFLYAFPVGILQTTITVLMKDSLGFNATQAGLVVTLLGGADILVQGVLVGWFLARLGNIKLGFIALALVSISYLVLGSIAFLATPILLLVGIILFAGSGSLVENALRGLISAMVGQREQGRVSGAMQSVQSLGWTVGPLVGGFVYTAWGHFQAYATASCITLLATVCIWIALPLLQKRQAKEHALGEQEATSLSAEN